MQRQGVSYDRTGIVYETPLRKFRKRFQWVLGGFAFSYTVLPPTGERHTGVGQCHRAFLFEDEGEICGGETI